MRITILWSALAGYSVALFRELANFEDSGLQLIYQKPQLVAPYEKFDLSFCEDCLEDRPNIRAELEDRVRVFLPDCVLMSGWAHPHFMRIARTMRLRHAYVIAAIDNQWQASLKQYLGIAGARWFLKPAIDTLLVAGERQEQLARRLGYEDVLRGCYAAEIDEFKTSVPVTSRPRAFLFIGRLVDAKNLIRLRKAYELYRERARDPWSLLIAGSGPLAPALSNVKGIELLGFVQPRQLPEVMLRARCLVLPSTFEPWGVVIHEAAAAGLLIIATYECGATTELVRDGVNGWIVNSGTESIATGMLRVTQSEDKELRAMSEASSLLAGLWSPRKLAGYLTRMLRERLA